LRSTFDPGRIRDCLHLCAEELTARGALLLTIRFHDHGQVFGLPSWLRRPLWQPVSVATGGWPAGSPTNWLDDQCGGTARGGIGSDAWLVSMDVRRISFGP
jgi:hypothetical protein